MLGSKNEILFEMCWTKKGEEKPSLNKEASAKCIIISVISGLIDPLGTDHESL